MIFPLTLTLTPSNKADNCALAPIHTSPRKLATDIGVPIRPPRLGVNAVSDVWGLGVEKGRSFRSWDWSGLRNAYGSCCIAFAPISADASGLCVCIAVRVSGSFIYLCAFKEPS